MRDLLKRRVQHGGDTQHCLNSEKPNVAFSQGHRIWIAIYQLQPVISILMNFLFTLTDDMVWTGDSCHPKA